MNRCCICGNFISVDSDLDPWPLNYDEDARCCQFCYTLKVFPAILRKRRYLDEHGLSEVIDVEFVEE